MKNPENAARRYRAALATSLLLAILFLPSLWMLRTVPPLWRDVDAYLQVTEPPGLVTILQFAPLYCFLARVPLYLGSACDCLRAGLSLPSLHFFAEPTLTDSGVALLLLGQHVALCCAAYLLIVSTARPFALRAVLAMMWAANPLFYAFAHCVGSETLSLILLLLLATTGIKIVTQPVKAPVALWLASGLLISLSMLTRHVNGVLAALLPLGIGFAGLSRLLAALSRKSGRERSWLLRAWRKDFRRAFLAVALGIASIMLAKATFRVVSHAAGLQYHTRVGFAFMFRLNFFGPLTPVEREPLLERAAAHSRSPDVQSVLSALRAAPTGPGKFDAMALLAQACALLPPETAASADKSDAVLNETARAFLVAPSAPYLKAVAADLIQSQRTTVLAIVRQLIQSTESYFLEPTNMPKCQNLVTFRDPRSREILHQLHKHPYFGFWKRFTYAHLLSIWGTLWIYVALLPRAGKAAVAPCAAALTVVGLLFVLATCILNEFQPRFALPAWELTIVSTTLLIGSAAEFLRHDALERSTSRQRRLRPAGS